MLVLLLCNQMMPSIDRVIENLGNYIKAKATTGEEVELKECVQLACL